MKPIANKVLIKPEKEEETKSGIKIARVAEVKSNRGEVVAVGPLVKTVKAGDKIAFCDYSSIDIKIEEEELCIVEEQDILGTLN